MKRVLIETSVGNLIVRETDESVEVRYRGRVVWVYEKETLEHPPPPPEDVVSPTVVETVMIVHHNQRVRYGRKCGAKWHVLGASGGSLCRRLVPTAVADIRHESAQVRTEELCQACLQVVERSRAYAYAVCRDQTLVSW